MFRIGAHEFANNVIAAPMAGVTDKANRIVAASFGCGLTFTEMISDQALLGGNAKTAQMLDLSGEMPQSVVQLFGARPENMGPAARRLEELGVRIIDINMGCPTPKIIRNGEGAALARDLKRARAVLRAVIRSVGVPVTVKMRKGWSETEINCVDLARMAEEEGAAAVTVHPRTRDQFYGGKADWAWIKAVKQAVSIPVIGNGDIFAAADARAMIEQTGCDAVMIARGALGFPFLFRDAAAVLTGQPLPPAPTVDERLSVALHHFDLVSAEKGPDRAQVEMRKHFAWYTRGIPGAAKARDQINQARSRSELVGMLQDLLSTAKGAVLEIGPPPEF